MPVLLSYVDPGASEDQDQLFWIVLAVVSLLTVLGSFWMSLTIPIWNQVRCQITVLLLRVSMLICFMARAASCSDRAGVTRLTLLQNSNYLEGMKERVENTDKELKPLDELIKEAAPENCDQILDVLTSKGCKDADHLVHFMHSCALLSAGDFLLMTI